MGKISIIGGVQLELNIFNYDSSFEQLEEGYA